MNYDFILRNIHYAIRTFLRTPIFTLTVILTLALGIGANTAVFSVIDAILLKPLPFPESDRLVFLRQVVDETETTIAPVRLEEWHNLNSSFEMISGYYTENVSDTTGELPTRVRRRWVAPRFMDVWGIRPLIGSGLHENNYHVDGNPAVMISEHYWKNHFDSDPHVLGEQVRIEGQSLTVTGVLPDYFKFANTGVEIFQMNPPGNQFVLNNPHNRQLRWYFGIGRLKPGVTLDQARADLTVVQSQLARQYPETDSEISISIEPLKNVVIGEVGNSLWLLFSAVSLLLLIACTNIAALLMSRSSERGREIAVRYSLGATRMKVITQMLIESLILSLAGALSGLLLSVLITNVFRLLTPDLPRLHELVIDWRILAYTLSISVIVAVLCGLVPALRCSRKESSLIRTGRGSVSSRHSFQWCLVGLQMALSITLLTGAGLLVRSIDNIYQVDPGFDPDKVLVFRISGNWSEAANWVSLRQRIDDTLEKLKQVSGIDDAATAWELPGIGVNFETDFERRDAGTDRESELIAQWRSVSPSYFKTLGIPLLAGDLCERRNLPVGDSPYQIMVNRNFVDKYYFKQESAISSLLAWEDGSQSGRITGIVGDSRENGINESPSPTVYTCDSSPNPFPWFLARTSSSPMEMTVTVREKIKQLEPVRSVYDLGLLRDEISDSYAMDRLQTFLLVFFALSALSLACLGVYGTLSFVVSLRRREIGLRMALGAVKKNIVSQFMSRVLFIVGIACVFGLLLSFSLTRFLSSMLYGVTPTDPLTLISVFMIVVVVSALASFFPAMRAACIDPMQALREE